MFHLKLRCLSQSNRHPTTKPNHIAIYYHFMLVYVVPERIRPFFPQIAIGKGVLTSNRGEGDEPLRRIGRGMRVALGGGDGQFWGSAGCHRSAVTLPSPHHSGRGAIAGCYGWGGRVTTNFGVVPL